MINAPNYPPIEFVCVIHTYLVLRKSYVRSAATYSAVAQPESVASITKTAVMIICKRPLQAQHNVDSLVTQGWSNEQNRESERWQVHIGRGQLRGSQPFKFSCWWERMVFT